jgi:hypothetical protein
MEKTLSNSTLLKKLRRARRTLRFMDSYFRLQAAMAEKDFISPGRDWRETYKDVTEMAAEWARKAMLESMPSKHSPIKDFAPRGMGKKKILKHFREWKENHG